jgi:cytochrome c biogenesis protein CcmG, thiol:disulfide interchange protein DsbE
MMRSAELGAGTGRKPALALAIVFAVFAVALAALAAPGIAGEQGSVPHFVLKDLDGKDVSLTDLTAKGPVVIDFWATWCKPCTRELPHVEALRKQYAEHGLTVAAISIDETRSVAKVKSYVKTHEYGFTTLLDSNQRVLRQLQGTGVPYLVVVSGDGRRVYSHSGYKDGDEAELAKVLAELMPGAEPAATTEKAATPAATNAANEKPASDSGAETQAGEGH